MDKADGPRLCLIFEPAALRAYLGKGVPGQRVWAVHLAG